MEEDFEGAEDKIRNAYEKRRKGDNKNAILGVGGSYCKYRTYQAGNNQGPDEKVFEVRP